MKWLKDIKVKVGQFFLNREIPQIIRKPKAVSLDSSNQIGIVYNASEKANHKIVKQYIRFLKEESKKVVALGYLDINREPEGLNNSREHIFFTNKDVNWYFKPEGKIPKSFVAQKFDILIDLSMDENIACRYVTGTSQACFKVGRFGENRRKYYDFMINLEEGNDLKFFIDQVNHYLQLINKPYVKQA